MAGHGGSGKTSLAEALLFKAGATDRLGKVADGNTVCDFDPEEVKRKVSVSSAVAPFSWGSVKINLIDTPGLFDFAAGMYEGVRAAESVLIAVSARSGLNVGAEKAYKLAEQMGKSRMFFVNKMDTENADFYKVLEELKGRVRAVGLPARRAAWSRTTRSSATSTWSTTRPTNTTPRASPPRSAMPDIEPPAARA